MSFRPVPGKFVLDKTHNRIVKVRAYASDGAGEYVECQLCGTYRATVRLTLSCLAPLEDKHRKELSDMVDIGLA